MDSRTVRCGCGANIVYCASDIETKERRSSTKDVTGQYKTNPYKVVLCKACKRWVEVYDRLDIYGDFID